MFGIALETFTRLSLVSGLRSPGSDDEELVFHHLPYELTSA